MQKLFDKIKRSIYNGHCRLKLIGADAVIGVYRVILNIPVSGRAKPSWIGTCNAIFSVTGPRSEFDASGDEYPPQPQSHS